MNLNLDQQLSAIRTIIVFAMGIATALGVLHLTSQQTQEAMTNIDALLNGAKSIAAIAGPIIAAVTGLISLYKASLQSQVKTVSDAKPEALVQAVQAVSPVMLRDAVAAQPEVKSVVVTTKAAADASPSPKVTS